MGQGTTRTVKEMAEVAGVSARTLRYYEDLGLLTPERTDAGYRVYRERDARMLAQVLAMKACGLPLGTIKRICAEPDADILGTLKSHRAVLQRQQNATADALRRTDAAIPAIGDEA
ncbi:MAG: MerR family transcriptional regulator [Coriobacteriaceae bacterium]